MSALPKPYYTPEEYLARERAAETKSEYIEGKIVARADVSFRHCVIAINAVCTLGKQFRRTSYQPLGSDMRIQVGPLGPFFYSDLLVFCGEPLLRDDNMQDNLLNPTVVFEVLSPSTEAYDRGEKFAHYRRIASLQEYVLVSQDKPRVERYVRQGDDWLLTEFSGMEAILELPSLHCSLPFTEIYDRIHFAEPEVGDDTEA